jgi:hypothetical protein
MATHDLYWLSSTIILLATEPLSGGWPISGATRGHNAHKVVGPQACSLI